MSTRRPINDFPRNEVGLVDRFLGTAYDVVKGVWEEIDTLKSLLVDYDTIQNKLDNLHNDLDIALSDVEALKNTYLNELASLAEDIYTYLTDHKDSILLDILNTANNAENSISRLRDAILIGFQDKIDAAEIVMQNATDAVYGAAALSGSTTYRTIALGIAGTDDGDKFWVFPNNDNDLENLVLYQNSNGTAVELYEQYNLNQFMIAEGDIWE